MNKQRQCRQEFMARYIARTRHNRRQARLMAEHNQRTDDLRRENERARARGEAEPYNYVPPARSRPPVQPRPHHYNPDPDSNPDSNHGDNHDQA